jgi:hypothetical protein
MFLSVAAFPFFHFFFQALVCFRFFSLCFFAKSLVLADGPVCVLAHAGMGGQR